MPALLPIPQLIELWNDTDKGGTDLHAVRNLCLIDRYYLLVRVCRRRDMLHPWIYERCREVEADPDGYLDLWAREHYKSTIITFGGSIQEILKNPEITIGIFSHTKPIAKKFLSQIKMELETNEVMKSAFPDILHQAPEKESPRWSLDAGIVVKRKGNLKESTVEAWGLVDGQPTAAHFALLMYDDVVTDGSVNTPEQITKTTEAWSMSDNLGMVGGRKRYAGTRYHFQDSYAHIIDKKAAKVRVHPATDDGTPDGRPVLFSQSEWNRRKRDQLEADIACQMLLNPLSGKQRMFDVKNYRIYEVRPLTLACYIICDPARSKKKDSANSAYLAVGIDYASNKYILDGFDHKMDLMERWERLKQLYVRWKQAPGIQSVRVGYEKFGAQSDLDYFQERMRTEKINFEIEELGWPTEGEGGKRDRIQRIGPDLKAHRYYLPYPTEQDRLTALQRKMIESGYGYRVAQPIYRKDENDQKYDLVSHLSWQTDNFPFGGRVDVLDALARIYDMEPRAPQYIDESQTEPEEV